MIEIEAVSKSFGPVKAVQQMHLRVPPGEIFCLLGPNGAGKTTTVKLLCGLLKPDQGWIRICGYDI
ncbi:MAG TPA: ATP-binding cassette domain-containing protein, partial [Kiritimatiellae bacterium]|nr:ATP-binding cassette domain-containing protein [Kiritimatiellia bacterium]